MNVTEVPAEGALRPPFIGWLMLPEFDADECEFYASIVR
jgi:hypothetical protein